MGQEAASAKGGPWESPRPGGLPPRRRQRLLLPHQPRVPPAQRWAHLHFSTSARAKKALGPEKLGKAVVECVCAEDGYGFRAYCAPARFWLPMACPPCLPDHFCGLLSASFSPDLAAVPHRRLLSPGQPQMTQTGSYVGCVCNLLADGCYSWEGAVGNASWAASLKRDLALGPPPDRSHPSAIC